MFNDAAGWLFLLFDISLKALLLATIASIALAVFRVSNANVRHRVWTAVLLGMLAMPVLVPFVPGLSIRIPEVPWNLDRPSIESVLVSEQSSGSHLRVDHATGLASDAIEVALPVAVPMLSDTNSQGLQSALPNTDGFAGHEKTMERSNATSGSVLVWNSDASSLMSATLAVYVCVTILLCVRLFIGVMRVAALVQGSTPVSFDSRQPMDGLAKGMLRESDQIRVPFTVGTLRPRVLLPLSWREWSDDKLDAVIQHELTHIARRDFSVNLLAEFNQCLYWFHPLAWGLARWLSDLAERNCDDAVIASTGDRFSYARHLMEIAASVADRPRTRIHAGVSMARSGDVETRIEAILDPDRPLSRRLGWRSTFLLIALTLPALGLAASLQAETTKQTGATAQVEPSTPKNTSDDDSPASLNDPINKHANFSTITGKVLDEKGQPIDGADLSLVLYSHVPDRDRSPAPPTAVWATAKSSVDGGFKLQYAKIVDAEYFTKRAYRLVAIARKDGHGLGWQFVDFESTQTEATIKLPLEQLRHGRLLDIEGQPMAGATVHVIGVGIPSKWKEFKKFPFHDGMPVDEQIMARIPVGDDDKLWNGEVRFRNPQFELPTWPRPVVSDKDGNFSVAGIAADHGIVLHAYGTQRGGSLDSHIEPGKGITSAKTLVLDEPHWITGVVTDKETGKGIAGAKVRVDPVDSRMMHARFQDLADWKGRQEHIGNLYAIQNLSSELMRPSAFTTTDDEGRYRISAFRNRGTGQNYAVYVSSPDDVSYLSTQKTIRWPGVDAASQSVDVQLQAGVLVKGVVTNADGQAVPRARIDFWSKQLRYPHNEIFNPNEFGCSPDGVQHPYWRKADLSGRFEVIVPRGESYLFVNADTVQSDTLVQPIDAAAIGLSDEEVLNARDAYMTLGAPTQSAGPQRFYPDRFVRLNYGNESVDEIEVQLNAPAPTLTVEVVDAKGNAVDNLIAYGGQPPFAHPVGGMSLLKRVKETNRFTLRAYNRDQPISVAFLARGRNMGIQADILPIEITDKVVRLQLQPLGRANATFVNVQGEPLPDYRPVCWLSVPREPFSSATDLETLETKQHYDSIWTGIVHKHMHHPLRTDETGKATFKALIPGATYRVSQFGGRIRDFRVKPGETIELGEITIHDPKARQDL